MSDVTDTNFESNISNEPNWFRSWFKNERFADVKFVEKGTGKFFYAHRLMLVRNSFFDQLFQSEGSKSAILPRDEQGRYIFEVFNLKIAELCVECIYTDTYDLSKASINPTSLEEICELIDLPRRWFMTDQMIINNFVFVYQNLDKILSTDISLIPVLYDTFEKQVEIENSCTKEVYTFDQLVVKMLDAIKDNIEHLGIEILDWNIATKINDPVTIMHILGTCKTDITTLTKYIAKFEHLLDDSDLVKLIFRGSLISADPGLIVIPSPLVQLERINQFMKLNTTRLILPSVIKCIINEFDHEPLRIQLGDQAMSLLCRGKTICTDEKIIIDKYLTSDGPGLTDSVLLVKQFFPLKCSLFKFAGKVISKSIRCKSFDMILEQSVKIGDELWLGKEKHVVNGIEWLGKKVTKGLKANTCSIICEKCHEYDLPNKNTLIYKVINHDGSN